MVWGAAVVAALSFGCARYTRPILPPRELTGAEKNFQAAWQAGQEVLRKYRFTLDRQDRRAGVITTRAMTGRHFFEFWRRDAATTTDLIEGTLQTIYRTAKITIRRTAPEADTYAADVEVQVARSNRPTAQVTSTSEAFKLFATAKESTERRALLGGRGLKTGIRPGGEGAYIVSLGRDANLEARLAAEIAAAAARRLGEYSRIPRPGTGNEEPGTGNKEPGTGNKEPGTGNEEPGTGNKEPGTGN